jgi:hypothetical protein
MYWAKQVVWNLLDSNVFEIPIKVNYFGANVVDILKATVRSILSELPSQYRFHASDLGSLRLRL